MVQKYIEDKNSSENVVVEEPIQEYMFVKSFFVCIGSSLVLKTIHYKRITSNKFLSFCVNVFVTMITIGVLVLLNYIDTKCKPNQFFVRIYLTLMILLQQIYFNFIANTFNTIFRSKDKNKLLVVLILANIYFPILTLIFHFIHLDFDLKTPLTNLLSNTFLLCNLLQNEDILERKKCFFVSIYISLAQVVYMFLLSNLINLVF